MRRQILVIGCLSAGLLTSVPVARRTLIASAGGSFTATLTSSVSRGPGQIQTFYVKVPAGQRDIDSSNERGSPTASRVTIQGPSGSVVSSDFPLNHWSCRRCRSRAVTSLAMV